jgi:hypothetical protein
MLKSFSVTLLAIALSVEFTQAKHMRHVHKHTKATRHVQTNAIPLKNAIPMCAEGQQVTATCACGTEASPSYSAGLEFELTGVAQGVELA